MSEDKNKEPSSEMSYTGRGITMGMLFGAALGLVIWLTSGIFVFFPVFVGAGLTIGIAIGMEQDEEGW